MQVRLIAHTQGVGELKGLTLGEILAYVARVSNPDNQMSHETAPRLLNYCLRNEHWSVFETCYLTMEVKTSRAISAQILRHRSFTFQEKSMRYATHESGEYPGRNGFEIYEARRQDTKNRQNSIDDMDEGTLDWFRAAQQENNAAAMELYEAAIARGIAKEQARFFLPLSTETTIYITGNVRSWLTYCKLRGGGGTQKEHRDIALQAKGILLAECPELAESPFWNA